MCKMTEKLSSKDYLNGIDWAINAIHSNSLEYSDAANYFIIVLELNMVPDLNRLNSLLEGFINKFPVLTGRIRRDIINLAPYWKYENNKKINAADIVSTVYDKTGNEPVKHITEFCNEPMSRDHILFRVLCLKNSSLLAVKFDHRLFDGRGAEGFLSLLQREWLGKDIFKETNNRKNPSHLNRWMDKLSSGKIFNRRIIKLLDNKIPINLSRSYSGKPVKYSYFNITFDEENTKRIISKANSEAGMFMLIPYLLVKFVKSFHSLISHPGICGEDYIIPVTVDQRLNSEVLKNVFHNNWSMIFLRLPSKEIENGDSRLYELIKRQLYDNVNNKYPLHMKNVNYLMRILPSKLMYKMSINFLKGTGGSFSFSFLKESVYEFSNFMDTEVINLYHIPNIPKHPGIGLFFTIFNNKLNATFCYINSILNDRKLNLIKKSLKDLAEN